MANEQHLELLRVSVDAWNRWRAENGQIVPDLRDAVLDGMNLSLANLTDSDLTGASLRLANLEGADLRWTNLTGANLVGARLIGADFQEANLSGADLRTAEDLTQEQIEATNGDSKTVLPDDITRPASWMRE